MEFVNFKKAWGLSLRENLIKNVIITILSVALVITSLGWFRSHETVVLVPPMLDERVGVASDNATDGYKKKWGYFVAQMMGNVHPGNVDFVLDGIEGLFSPAAYREIKGLLAEQIADIKRDSLTISFEPKQVVYEHETDKVFVTGDFQSGGPSGKPRKLLRSYEMKVAVRFGQPWVDEFTVYTGPPKTLAVRAQEAAAQGGTAK
jgi:conjugal transfer pilus assembly protein TraE